MKTDDIEYNGYDDDEDKKKKRRILLLLLLLIFFVVGVITVVLVLAANQQRINSNIDVSYKANNITAEVSAKYWKTGSEKLSMYNGNSSIVSFGTNDNESQKSLSPTEIINLESATEKLFFEYTFNNLSDSVAFSISLNYTPKTSTGNETTNIVERFYVSNTELSVDQFNSLEESQFLNSYTTQTIDKGINKKLYIYVIVESGNDIENSSYSGSFSWELSKI